MPEINPGQLYSHWKGGRKALIVCTGYSMSFMGRCPHVAYIHEGEHYEIPEGRFYGLSAEYGQCGKPLWWCKYVAIQKDSRGHYRFGSVDDDDFEAEPTLLYVRTEANFLEDLGEGKTRFTLGD